MTPYRVTLQCPDGPRYSVLVQAETLSGAADRARESLHEPYGRMVACATVREGQWVALIEEPRR